MRSSAVRHRVSACVVCRNSATLGGEGVSVHGREPAPSLRRERGVLPGASGREHRDPSASRTTHLFDSKSLTPRRARPLGYRSWRRFRIKRHERGAQPSEVPQAGHDVGHQRLRNLSAHHQGAWARGQEGVGDVWRAKSVGSQLRIGLDLVKRGRGHQAASFRGATAHLALGWTDIASGMKSIMADTSKQSEITFARGARSWSAPQRTTRRSSGASRHSERGDRVLQCELRRSRDVNEAFQRGRRIDGPPPHRDDVDDAFRHCALGTSSGALGYDQGSLRGAALGECVPCVLPCGASVGAFPRQGNDWSRPTP